MKNRTQAIFVIVIITAVFTITAMIITFPLSAQNKVQNKKDEPTPIQIGVMTDKQRNHSKFYNQPEKSRSLIETTNKDLKIIIGAPYKTRTSDSVSQEDYFQNVVCQSDSVVTAEVISKASQLSEDKKSVFTDYELRVSNVIKDNSGAHLQIDSLFTVTRSGGIVKINNRIIEVVDESYKSLSVGSAYLLFLDYLADSGSFRASDTEGSFEVVENALKRASNDTPKYVSGNTDLNTFVKSISNLNGQCAN